MSKSDQVLTTLTLKLILDGGEQHFFDKAFALGVDIHIAAKAEAVARLAKMRASSDYSKAIRMPKGKKRNQELARIQRQYGLTSAAMQRLAVDIKNSTGRGMFLGSHEAQSIGENVWDSVANHLFRKKGKPRFKSRRHGIHSICGKCNTRTVLDKLGKPKKVYGDLNWVPAEKVLMWRGRKFRVEVPDDEYTRLILTKDVCAETGKADAPRVPAEVKYCRIIRKRECGTVHYYLQLVIANKAPILHAVAPRSVRGALDLGPSKAGFVSESGDVALQKVSPNAEMDFRNLARLQRALDRSLRATNPQNYEPDFTAKVGRRTVVKKGKVKKGAHKWVYSKNSLAILEEIREAYRVQAETRRRDHGTLINLMFASAGHIQLEKVSYLSFQKNYGRSAQRQAMGSFDLRMKQKASYAAVEIVELNARELAMSQWDHITGEFKKKPLSQRWHRLGETDWIIQRDVYSAILACCAVPGSDSLSNPTASWVDRKSVMKLVKALEPQLLAAGLLRQFEPPKSCGWAEALPRLRHEPVVGLSLRGGRQTRTSAAVTSAI